MILENKKFYDTNRRIFSSLKINISNINYIILIDNCMNSNYEEGKLFCSWEILVKKYDNKTQ